MNLTRSIFNNAVFFFLAIFLFSFWGFWVTYFTRPSGTVAGLEHLHGIAMYGWVLLLITQASLIRLDRRDLHRTMGKLSYLLVPVIFVSTLYLGHSRLLAREMSDEGVYVLGLQFLGLVPFTVFYLMAMLRRSKPDVHARWMVCTGITMIDPIFARGISINFMPGPIESGVVNALCFGGMALLTASLAFLDYRGSGRKDVFLPALLIMALPQFLFLASWDGSAWRGFSAWYAALPLN